MKIRALFALASLALLACAPFRGLSRRLHGEPLRGAEERERAT